MREPVPYNPRGVKCPQEGIHRHREENRGCQGLGEDRTGSDRSRGGFFVWFFFGVMKIFEPRSWCWLHPSVKTRGSPELYLSWAKCEIYELNPTEAVMYTVVT